MTGMIFLETLRRHWKQILWWGGGLGIYAIYPFVVIPDQSGLEGYADLLDSFDPAMMRAVGITDATSFTTPEGFIGYAFFGFALLVMSVYAVMAGLNITANEEDRGIMDMFLSLPIPRWQVIIEKVLAYSVIIIAICGFAFGGLLIGRQLGSETFDLAVDKLLIGTINIIPGTIFVLGFTTFVGVLVRRRTTAMAISGVFVVGSYLLDTIGRAANSETSDAVRQLSIFAHYNGTTVLTDGIALGGALAILSLAVILCGASTQLFERRDIAV
ncbi:MAG: ABC transporter permease subunit [Aggregatilineales bacterium]